MNYDEWKTGRVTDMAGLVNGNMRFALKSTFNGNISKWDTSALIISDTCFFNEI